MTHEEFEKLCQELKPGKTLLVYQVLVHLVNSRVWENSASNLHGWKGVDWDDINCRPSYVLKFLWLREPQTRVAVEAAWELLFGFRRRDW